MAVDGYMFFYDYNGVYLKSESQVDLSAQKSDDISKPFLDAVKADPAALFEIKNFSFNVEQTLNIGSSTSGAGAGKITFNPFSIDRNIDKSSSKLFQMTCAGTPFQRVSLGLRKSAGGTLAGSFYLRFDFKLVAVKTLSWAYDDESPTETVEFEYGALIVNYGVQNPDGTIASQTPGGWNKVKNIADTDAAKKIG